MDVQDLGREQPADAEHRDEREQQRHQRDAADVEADVERIEDPAQDVVDEDGQQQQAAPDERADNEDQVLDRDLEHPPTPSHRLTDRVVPGAPLAPDRKHTTRRAGPDTAWRHARRIRSERLGRPAADGRARLVGRAEQQREPGLQRRDPLLVGTDAGRRGTRSVRAGARDGRVERERDLALATEAVGAGLLEM